MLFFLLLLLLLCCCVVARCLVGTRARQTHRPKLPYLARARARRVRNGASCNNKTSYNNVNNNNNKSTTFPNNKNNKNHNNNNNNNNNASPQYAERTFGSPQNHGIYDVFAVRKTTKMRKNKNTVCNETSPFPFRKVPKTS